MAEEPSPDWSTNSNECINISLVTPARGGGVKTIATFKPTFTYALFGQQESIFGYKGLKINFQYNACDMRPNVNTHYSRKYKQIGETEALKLQPILEEFLPTVAFQKIKTFEEHIYSADIYKNWKPPGKLINEYQAGPYKRRFEVWKASTAQEDTVQYLKRIQILVPFFIDGGTLIDLKEAGNKRWTMYFLFERKNNVPENVSPYVFMGYATVYRYYPIGDINQSKSIVKSIVKKKAPDFRLPWPKPPTFPCRSRISQFLILPPFRGCGHGSRLYRSIYDVLMGQSNVIELTVEDPNESFDNLRDLNDLIHLRSLRAFCEVSINPKAKINPKGRFLISEALSAIKLHDKHGKTIPELDDYDNGFLLEQIRIGCKIAPRQFSRILEMQLLSKIPSNLRQSKIYVTEKGKDENQLKEEKQWKHVYHLWLLIVKSRLHKHNREVLMQIDKPDRADHLEAAAGGVQAAYEEMLELMEKSAPKLETSSQASKEHAEPNGDEERTSLKEKRAADPADISGEEPLVKKVKRDNKGLATLEKSGDSAVADKDAIAANENAKVEASFEREVIDLYPSSDSSSDDEMDSSNIITDRTRGVQIDWAKAAEEHPADGEDESEDESEDGDFNIETIDLDSSDVEMGVTGA